MKNAASCPITLKQIYDKEPRYTALLVIVVVFLFILSNNVFILFFLLVDFFLRSTKFGRLSLLGFFGKMILSYQHDKGNRVDIAPKKFAAKLGTVWCIVILLSYFLLPILVTISFALVLILLASLEAFGGVCVGCILYQQLNRIGWKV